jgi:hypothetical protein
VHPAVAALSPEEKGLVLGALLARMPAGQVAGRVAGAAAGRCAAAIEALGAAPKPERAAALAALLALVRAPVPAGVERIEPGWLRERLAREPSDVILAVTDGLPDEVRRVAAALLAERADRDGARTLTRGAAAELQRSVFAGFVPLAGPGAPSGPLARRLLALTPRALEEAIEARGAEALGVSLRGAPGEVVARAAAGLGDRLGSTVVRAAAREGTTEARDAARTLVAAAGVHQGRETAWALGCRALAAELGEEGASAVVAVAERLAPERGRSLLAAVELEGLL